MIDVLTNPITLLCLGVVFILISSLFFYFRRSLSVLERAQMEQARILESFITNMEMSKMAQQHHNIGGGPVNMEINQEQNNTNLTNNYAVEGVRNQNLIDVSDENVSDGDSDGDSDSDTDSDDSSDESGDESGDDVSININMNVSNEINNDVANNDSFIGNNIKVIQLNDSEDLENLNNSTFDIKSLDDSSTDSDDEDDEDGESDINDNHYTESEHDDIIKLPTIIQPVSEPSIVDASVNLPTPDLKSLNVQALRQMAENKLLIAKGEKKTKKELLLLLK